MTASQSPKLHQTSDPALWVDRHGDWLYRYAILRVRDRHLAEDLVQDALLAGVQGRQKYSGAASERTWLTAILRNKIVSHFRKTELASQSDVAGENWPAFFDHRGKWKQDPLPWSARPEDLLEQAEFWEVLRQCMSKLGRRSEDIYVLREIEQLSTEKICEVLGISANNLWTQLHRARASLRRCLEDHWFAPGAGREGP